VLVPIVPVVVVACGELVEPVEGVVVEVVVAVVVAVVVDCWLVPGAVLVE
jgi:hypothetical protein